MWHYLEILTCDVKGQLRYILKDGINEGTTHVLTDIIIFNIFPENDTQELVEIRDLKLEPAALKSKASMYFLLCYLNSTAACF